MIRQPTPDHVLYAWWLAALGGRSPQITSEPQCGWFQRKLVREGPWVPVRIFMRQVVDADGELIEPEELLCEVDGQLRDAVDQWTYVCDQPISRERYRFMTANATWAKKHAPAEPEANPREAVDWTKAPLPF
jgi:hypothetical protein